MDPAISQQQIQPEIPQTSKFSFIKSAKVWPVIVLLILLIPATGYFLSKNQASQTACTMEAKLCPDGSSVGRTGPKCEFSPCPTPKPTSNVSILSDREKQQIDSWIAANNLNSYGDPKDTVYAGGTPLFNEATGQRTDRYDYISDKYLDRPWCTPRPACLDGYPPCLIAEAFDMCPKR